MNKLEKPIGQLTTTFLGELASRVENGEKIQFEFEGKKYLLDHTIENDYGCSYSIGLFFTGVDNPDDICCMEIDGKFEFFNDKDYVDFDEFEVIFDEWLCF